MYKCGAILYEAEAKNVAKKKTIFRRQFVCANTDGPATVDFISNIFFIRLPGVTSANPNRMIHMNECVNRN